MKWNIRKAKKEDESRIRELFIEMLQAIYHTQNVCGYKEGYLDKFFEDRGDFICVAEANSSIIAYLSIEVHHEPEDFIFRRADFGLGPAADPGGPARDPGLGGGEDDHGDRHP